MTDRPSSPRAARRRRRHAAAGSRVLATGISVAAVLGLTAGWAATPDQPVLMVPAPAVRAVVTDVRIPPDLAARAAVTAAAAGQTRAHVQLAAVSGSSAGAPPPDVTSRAS